MSTGIVSHLFCAKGGIIWIFLNPIFNLLSFPLIPVFLLSWGLWVGLYFALNKASNEALGKDNWQKSLGFSFLFYYLASMLLSLFFRLTLCALIG